MWKRENNFYEIKIAHRYNVKIWTLITISLHENVGSVGANLHIQGVHIHSSFTCSICGIVV